MILRFGFDEPAVVVEVPDRETARAVAGLYSGYLLSRREGEEAASCLTVRRRAAGFRIEGEASLLGGDGSATAEDPVELVARVEIALTRGLLARRPDWPHLHAAGAAAGGGGGGVLALGGPGAGKSSLALAWSASGHRLLGDDVVLVGSDGRARSFRRLLKVAPGRLREHEIDPEATPHWASGWDRAWFDPDVSGAGWCTEPVRPRVVAFIRREPGAPLRAEEVRPAEALGLLLAGLLGTGASQAASVDPLRRLLDGVRPVILRYGGSARAAAHLIDLARDGGGAPERRSPPRGSGSGSGGEAASTSVPPSGGGP